MGQELNKEFYNETYTNGGSEQIYFKDFSETPWVNVWSEIINEIKINNYKNVLDIGCGPGQFASFLFTKVGFINYFGVDFSEVAIDFAKKNVPEFSFLCANAKEFDFTSIDYDVVVITEFLEHVEWDIELLLKLKKGVLVLATLPNMDSEGHVKFLSKNSETAKQEIKNRYGEICEILSIDHFPYEANLENGDHLIKMITK